MYQGIDASFRNLSQNFADPPFVKRYTVKQWQAAWARGEADDPERNGRPVLEAMRERNIIWIVGTPEENFLKEDWDWTLECLERLVPGNSLLEVQGEVVAVSQI